MIDAGILEALPKRSPEERREIWTCRTGLSVGANSKTISRTNAFHKILEFAQN